MRGGCSWLTNSRMPGIDSVTSRICSQCLELLIRFVSKAWMLRDEYDIVDKSKNKQKHINWNEIKATHFFRKLILIIHYVLHAHLLQHFILL